MSKNKPLEPVYGNGYALSSQFPGMIEGRVLTLIETLGLPDKQESSIKSLISQAIWNVVLDYEKAIFLSEDTYGKLREEYWKVEKESRAKGVPMPAI